MNTLKSSILFAIASVVLLSNCSNDDQETVQPIIPTTPTVKDTAWARVFTDEFSTTASWTNWSRTQRFDYNSSLCSYLSSNAEIEIHDDLSCLVLTAVKNGGIWNSGHVKSNYSFKPAKNTEYRTAAYIKLIALEGETYKGFAETYGLWPAFWTVQETSWPVNGEIDIMEGYSFAGTTRFASNLFYGTTANVNLLGTSCEKTYDVAEGWHLYEQYWKNVNGTVTITIKIDGVAVSTYTNSSNSKLALQNFGPHTIMLNLNVGCTTWAAFDNNLINVFTKSMMWVDYVTVDKRNI